MKIMKMIDRDIADVIEWLEECLRLLDCVGTQEECKKLVSDVIVVLKEQKEEMHPCENCQEFECDGCPYADD